MQMKMQEYKSREKREARGVVIENIPESNLEMIRRVKYYERLAARGIVNRSRKDITECLTMHPLVGSYSLASKLTDEYIKLNAPYIGDWRD